MDTIPHVDIEKDGVFKYILIKISDSHDTKVLVRGYLRSEWHADIFDEVQEKLSPLGYQIKCLGGGRIRHDSKKKKIEVYGYSQGFGKADHEQSVELLKQKYPEYDISWSDDGY
ncbi:14 kDa phosphohistidine phosphatase-like [Ctenocephalides felis]|uniref:14 kDa phosphohistidine phosphatase-like n=1 Tax=Ctenocephalides felis TaxID=7515 RepID=UPI000E6E4B25|nr:14 kDa phosphohistidine phosphatase-like [Ctenocephalides felis]